MGNQGMIKRLLRGLLPAALYGVGQEGVRRYRRQRQAAAPKLDEGACCRLLGEESESLRVNARRGNMTTDTIDQQYRKSEQNSSS